MGKFLYKEKQLGTLGVNSAKNLLYDNSNSSLEAITTQDAIDKVVENINIIEEKNANQDAHLSTLDTDVNELKKVANEGSNLSELVRRLDRDKANVQDPRFNGSFRIGIPQGTVGQCSFATGYRAVSARNTAVFNYNKTTKILELEENYTNVDVGTTVESIRITKTDDSYVDFDVTGVILSKTQARIDSGFDGNVTNVKYVYVFSIISNIASGANSHAKGYLTTASANNSHAEGQQTTASGSGSHAEGGLTTASGQNSHAEGNATNRVALVITDFSTSTTDDAIITAWNSSKFSLAKGEGSHIEGKDCLALGQNSHAEGQNTTASVQYSHAEGFGTTASNKCSHAGGHLNANMTTGGSLVNTAGTAFAIGNGTSSTALSNAFSVQFSGVVKAKSTITASTTADYAEFFEWLDENPNDEDRVGYFVTLDGDKIKIATDKDDYILGVVSGEPFVLGNGDCDTWNGMYLHDEFRRTMYEPAPKMIEILDEEGRPTGEWEEVEGEFEGTRPVLNPNYDHTQPYISRFDRKEWSPIGMLGVLAVRHDGTARVNGYVTVNENGIATACDKNTENAYRVIKANTDDVVEIIFK